MSLPSWSDAPGVWGVRGPYCWYRDKYRILPSENFCEYHCKYYKSNVVGRLLGLCVLVGVMYVVVKVLISVLRVLLG